jgi:hypothetical protein
MAAKPKNVVYGEVQVEAGAGFGKLTTGTVSPDVIVGMADTIWGKIQQSGVEPADRDDMKLLAREIQSKYSDFVNTYPIVYRWMLHTREYESDVFRRFIVDNAKKATHRSRAEFLESQADYLMLLYRKRHPRMGATVVARRRELLTRSLKKDDKEFKEAVEQAAEIVKEDDKIIHEKRRTALIAWALRTRRP